MKFLNRSKVMSCSSSSGSEEDDEGFDSYRKGGYHAVRVADQFAGGRYIAQRKLGWGQFSTVWLAYDTTTSVCLILTLLFFILLIFLCLFPSKGVVLKFELPLTFQFLGLICVLMWIVVGPFFFLFLLIVMAISLFLFELNDFVWSMLLLLWQSVLNL